MIGFSCDLFSHASLTLRLLRSKAQVWTGCYALQDGGTILSSGNVELIF
jgi:hypothetical protein